MTAKIETARTFRGAVRQTWWAPIAALLGVEHVVMIALIGFSDEDLESRLAGALLLLAGALAAGVGLWLRQDRRWVGSGLLLVSCVLGVFWFWTLFLPVTAVVVAIGMVSGVWLERKAREPLRSKVPQ